MKIFLKYFFLLISFSVLYGSQVKFDKVYGTEVWSHRQTITGTVSSANFTSALIYVNKQASQLNLVTNLNFSADVLLTNGINEIYVVIDSSGTKFYSDTIRVRLGYKILPEVTAHATTAGTSITLTAEVNDNPKNLPMAFCWSEDPRNPITGLVLNQLGSSFSFSLPANAGKGEYYFDLYCVTNEGDTAKSRTFITVTENSINAFDIKKDHAAWIDKAIVYQVTPYCFVENGRLVNVTQKIPELAELGINTIYLQPIYQTKRGGQGYDVVDYFKIRSNYGSETDLRNLVVEARKYGMHVILDFVPNHASIEHYFAKHSLQFGTKSHYYNYFQRRKDNSPYAGNSTLGSNGFVYYFDWSYMPNLNFENIEMQNYILNALKYWVQNFDIDGFRFDAVWAVTARSPEFTKKIRLALKRIKPEIFLLAEDKAAQAQVFDERFDAAYDWAAEYSWVSHWVWQTNYSPYQTVFMQTSNQSKTLRNSLTNNGLGYAADSKILRFIENNDTDRFIIKHGLERTKMAAALLFSLNGVPMMYNGQEVGNETHPYSTWMIYWANTQMKYLDSKYQLLPFYKNLIALRKKYKALTANNFEEIALSPNNAVYGFRRWLDKENLFSVINMGNVSAKVSLNIPTDKMSLDSDKVYYLTNLLNGNVISGKVDQLKTAAISLNKYETGIFLFADTAAVVVGVDDYARDFSVPAEFVLHQNFPNPFNPLTVINYEISTSGFVTIKVYDMLGREVAVPVTEFKIAGKYAIEFNASQLASGVYLYRLEHNGKSVSKKMLLMK